MTNPGAFLSHAWKPLPPLPRAQKSRPACSVPVEIVEQILDSLDGPPDYQAIWRDWRLVSRGFKAGTESVFERIYLHRISIRIVLDQPPKLLYFRLWDLTEDGQHAVFRDCRYRPESLDQSEAKHWGQALAHWERTTITGWKKRWGIPRPPRPANRVVVELGQQKKFMELPELLVNLDGIDFQCDWRLLLARFFATESRKVHDDGSRRVAASCYFPSEWAGRTLETCVSPALALLPLQRNSIAG